jgi:hypothetical protein
LLCGQTAPTMSRTRKKRTTMRVQVEQRTNHLGPERPVRFRFEIVQIVDQWYGPDYSYFKIKGNDGNLYILRFDESRVAWELTMFRSPDVASPSCQSLTQCTERELDSRFSRFRSPRIGAAVVLLRPNMSSRRSRPSSNHGWITEVCHVQSNRWPHLYTQVCPCADCTVAAGGYDFSGRTEITDA